MTLCRTAEIVAGAPAVAAFNVITLEHVEAVVAGAERAHQPVIIQVSQNAVRFHEDRLVPLTRAAAAAAEQATVPVALHLDHVTDLSLLKQAPEAGFSSAMFDAGDQPYELNLRTTRQAADWAHEHGLWLEAELGYVGGKPSASSAHADGVRTDPAEATAFVADTGVDALAVAVGSKHAMTERTSRLDHDLIQRLAAALDVPLVLHGSSGVPDDELGRAVAAGMVKVNIGTALNIAYTNQVRDHLAEHPGDTDPRKYLRPARAAMADTVAHLADLIGRSGKG